MGALGAEVPQHLPDDGVVPDFLLVAVAEDQQRGLLLLGRSRRSLRLWRRAALLVEAVIAVTIIVRLGINYNNYRLIRRCLLVGAGVVIAEPRIIRSVIWPVISPAVGKIMAVKAAAAEAVCDDRAAPEVGSSGKAVSARAKRGDAGTNSGGGTSARYLER